MNWAAVARRTFALCFVCRLFMLVEQGALLMAFLLPLSRAVIFRLSYCLGPALVMFLSFLSGL